MLQSRASVPLLVVAAILAVCACKPPEPLALPESPLEEATVSAAYSRELGATGGVEPRVYSAQGVPAGLTLSSDTGVLSGTPTAAGDFNLSVSVTDSEGKSVTREYALKVYPAPSITTAAALGYTYVGETYRLELAATGGKPPLVWELERGALPPGLSLAREGTLSGTLAAGVTNGQELTLTVRVSEANGARATRALTLTTYELPDVTTSLTPATEGVTYRRAPGTPEQLSARGGKAPLRVEIPGGLPEGLSFDPATGVLSGLPAQGSAGSYDVSVVITDANDKENRRRLPLPVVAPQPLKADGTVGREPEGSPITDVLTVFAVDEGGLPKQGVGVRLRKNGAEYNPVKEALTDAQGKAFFSGLELNGTTDTVDITANGRGLWNVTLAQVNASLVTLLMPSYPLPLPRLGASATFDSQARNMLVTMGRNLGYNQPSRTPSCLNDILWLSDLSTATWSEVLPPGMEVAPPARMNAGFLYVGNGVSLLFGGEDCNLSLQGDTWEYVSDTSSWEQYTPAAAPSPRKEMALAPSPTTGEALLFGGYLGETTTRPTRPEPSNELWAYQASTHSWSLLSPSGTAPSARYAAAAALDSTTGEVWLCGGFAVPTTSPSELSDCSRYTRSSNSWDTAPALPESRSDFGMAYRPGDGLYVFGGRSGGTPRNDLLRYRPDTGWERVIAHGAAGSPPPSSKVNLVHDTVSDLLVLLISQSSEVWTFDGTSWTKRSSEASASPRYTVSGTLTREGVSGNASATVWATSATGFSTTSYYLPLPGGQGSYSLADKVPAGTILSMGVMVQGDGGWAYVDLGEVGPITADTTLNIAVPPGTTPYSQVTGSFTPPSYWPTTEPLTRYVRAFVRKPGYPLQQSGPWNISGPQTPTFSFDYFSLGATTSQGAELRTESLAPEACESLTAYLYDLAPGSYPPVTMPEGARELSPGLSQCATEGFVPYVDEGTFQFTAPAGTRLWTMTRGASGMTWDWKYMSKGQPGATTFTLPLPSTLAPARRSFSGQIAAWAVTAYTFPPQSRFDYANLRWHSLDYTGKAESFSYRYGRR